LPDDDLNPSASSFQFGRRTKAAEQDDLDP